MPPVRVAELSKESYFTFEGSHSLQVKVVLFLIENPQPCIEVCDLDHVAKLILLSLRVSRLNPIEITRGLQLSKRLKAYLGRPKV